MQKRITIFDTVRGFTMISMAGFHACYDLAYLYDWNMPWSSTELSVAWNLQNRPEFHRRVFSAGLKYRWPTRDGRVQYTSRIVG